MENNTSNEDVVNVAYYLKDMARRQPYKRAVVAPVSRDRNDRIAYAHMTFRQLDQESDCIAAGLERVGIVRGTKTILMVKPCLDFFAITFALFKAGAVPVVVDPGMGIKRMLSCMQESAPEAFIGIPLAHLLRTFCPGYFKTVKTFVTVGRRLFWGGLNMSHIKKVPWASHSIAKTKKNETAAILFTSGSTGPAKGVVYTHGNFDAQIKQIKAHFEITPDEIDLPTFPLFALFDPALGMTAVIPDMDPTKPALVDPRKIIEAIINQGVTNMFASPALLNRVGRFGEKNKIKVPSLKRVVSAGAPVPPVNIERFAKMLSETAEVHTPYGATEAVPIISISSNEILGETRDLSDQGFGNCIGRPINNINIRLIRISDSPIETFSEDLLVPQGEIGEFIVKGDLVSKSYYKKPKHNALHKIKEGDEIWHRMGDLGWQDKNNRFWFCGRKSHRVITKGGTLYTIPCEAIFNTHKSVYRSALVGIGPSGNQKPVICIELEEDNTQDKQQIEIDLLSLAKKNVITQDINIFLFHKSFPVDIRHNSKIFREKLAVWAEEQLK
ncbi:MAG: fatty acid CoA ligase family protein [Desulfobacterales bacterium]